MCVSLKAIIHYNSSSQVLNMFMLIFKALRDSMENMKASIYQTSSHSFFYPVLLFVIEESLLLLFTAVVLNTPH